MVHLSHGHSKVTRLLEGGVGDRAARRVKTNVGLLLDLLLYSAIEQLPLLIFSTLRSAACALAQVTSSMLWSHHFALFISAARQICSSMRFRLGGFWCCRFVHTNCSQLYQASPFPPRLQTASEMHLNTKSPRDRPYQAHSPFVSALTVGLVHLSIRAVRCDTVVS